MIYLPPSVGALLHELADALDPPPADLSMEAMQARNRVIARRSVYVTAKLRALADGTDPGKLAAALTTELARVSPDYPQTDE